jgi:TPR repeat protein
MLLLFTVLHSPVAKARDWKEDQANADQYYAEGKYSKAFGLYYRNAKIGVSDAQDMVSQMYEKGQGKHVNLEDAYAWSVLAAERGSTTIAERRDSLLERVKDKKSAQKKADKLLIKYGRAALQKKADSKARLKANTKSGGCTGSKLDCR